MHEIVLACEAGQFQTGCYDVFAKLIQHYGNEENLVNAEHLWRERTSKHAEAFAMCREKLRLEYPSLTRDDINMLVQYCVFPQSGPD